MTPVSVISQREQARRKANATRVAHAQTKQQIRDLSKAEAVALAATIIRHPEQHEMTLPVYRLLLAIPRCGKQRARVLLRHIGIVGEARRIGELTQRQRNLLADRLDWPTSDLARTRGLPMEAVVDHGRAGSAAALLAALRPDVRDPHEVARLVLGHDDERRAA